MEHFHYKEHLDYIIDNEVVDATVESIRGTYLILNITESNEKITTRTYDQNVIKRWKVGQEFRLFNRVDVRSTIDKMVYEGYVSSISEDKVNISYKRKGKIYSEEYEKNSNNIFPIGKFSSKFNPNTFTSEDVNLMLKKNRYNVKNININSNDNGDFYNENIIVNTNDQNEDVSNILEFEQKKRELILKRFIEVSSKKGFNLKLIEGDGNCLYRSFSHQLYGQEEFYPIVKNVILDYLEIEKDFFCKFVCGYSFEDYINMKRLDGVWGDDLEIQAFSEIYNAQIFIYTDDKEMTLLKRFNDDSSEIRKIKINISYHGKEHYNSLIIKGGKNLISEDPGIFEKSFIENIKNKKNLSKLDSNMDLLSTGNTGLNFLDSSIENCNGNIDIDLEKIRQIFLKGKFFNDEIESKNLKCSKNNINDNFENDNIQNTNEINENKYIIDLNKENIAEKSSIQTNKLEENISKTLITNSELDYNDKLVLESIINESKLEERNKSSFINKEDNYQSIIQSVIDMGFAEEEVMMAYSAVGGDIDLILQYLYSLNY